jgi:hypothetical protein
MSQADLTQVPLGADGSFEVENKKVINGVVR